MEPININYVEKQSNYRLRNEPVRLVSKALVGVVPDGDGWRQVWDETVGSERYRSAVRLREGRKQRAAREVRPINLITLTPKLEARPKPFVMAVLENKTEQEIEIARLKSEIAKYMGLLK